MFVNLLTRILIWKRKEKEYIPVCCPFWYMHVYIQVHIPVNGQELCTVLKLRSKKFGAKINMELNYYY